MIRAECPSCQTKLRAPAKAASRQIACPKCGTKIPIPRAADGPEESTEHPVCPACAKILPTGSRICVDCGIDLITGKKLAGPEERKKQARRRRVRRERAETLAEGCEQLAVVGLGIVLLWLALQVTYLIDLSQAGATPVGGRQEIRLLLPTFVAWGCFFAIAAVMMVPHVWWLPRLSADARHAVRFAGPGMIVLGVIGGIGHPAFLGLYTGSTLLMGVQFIYVTLIVLVLWKWSKLEFMAPWAVRLRAAAICFGLFGALSVQVRVVLSRLGETVGLAPGLLINRLISSAATAMFASVQRPQLPYTLSSAGGIVSLGRLPMFVLSALCLALAIAALVLLGRTLIAMLRESDEGGELRRRLERFFVFSVAIAVLQAGYVILLRSENPFVLHDNFVFPIIGGYQAILGLEKRFLLALSAGMALSVADVVIGIWMVGLLLDCRDTARAMVPASSDDEDSESHDRDPANDDQEGVLFFRRMALRGSAAVLIVALAAVSGRGGWFAYKRLTRPPDPEPVAAPAPVDPAPPGSPARLLLDLCSADAAVRREAIGRLEAGEPPLDVSHIPALLNASAQKDTTVAEAVSGFVRSFGAEAVPPLAAAFSQGGDHHASRILAARLLGELKQTARPASAALARSIADAEDNYLVRQHAAEALRAIGPPYVEIVPDLKAAVGSARTDQLRELCVELLMTAFNEEPISLATAECVALLVQSRCPAARNALTEFPAAALPVLLAELESRDEQRIQFAVSVLGAFGRPARDAVPALEELRDSDNPSGRPNYALRDDLMRKQIDQALKGIAGGGGAAMSGLTSLFRSRRNPRDEHPLHSLPVSALAVNLKSAEKPLRRATIHALGRRQGEDQTAALALLASELARPDADLDSDVFNALARFPASDEGVAEAVAAGLRREQPEVRERSAAILVSAGRSAVPLLVGLLNDSSEHVRHSAASALAGMPGDALRDLGDPAVIALSRLLERDGPSTRNSVVDVLSTMQTSAGAAAPMLEDAIRREQDPALRARLERALKAVTGQEK